LEKSPYPSVEGKAQMRAAKRYVFVPDRKFSTPNIGKVVSVCELSPANYYESQILSSLPNWKGNRLLSYELPDQFDYRALYKCTEAFYEQKDFFTPIKKLISW
jgi:hypothetical protein